MSDRPQLLLPYMPEPENGRLLVIPTRDLTDWLVEKLAMLHNADYNLNEVGSVLIETLDTQLYVPGNPEPLGAKFSDYMARRFATDEAEYQQLVPVFDEVYGMVANRIAALQLEQMSKDHLGLSFFMWSGGDLVVKHHPLPH